MTYLKAGRDLAPLLRTLLRLRHDFVMIGRAASAPLPAELQLQFGPLLTRICDAVVDYLRASGVALVARQRVTCHPILDAAFDEYAAEMGMLRQKNHVRDLPVDVLERIFTLGFAFEQLRGNFSDLERCIAEHSERRRSRRPFAA